MKEQEGVGKGGRAERGREKRGVYGSFGWKNDLSVLREVGAIFQRVCLWCDVALPRVPGGFSKGSCGRAMFWSSPVREFEAFVGGLRVKPGNEKSVRLGWCLADFTL